MNGLIYLDLWLVFWCTCSVQQLGYIIMLDVGTKIQHDYVTRCMPFFFFRLSAHAYRNQEIYVLSCSNLFNLYVLNHDPCHPDIYQCTADSGLIYLMKGIENQHQTSLLEHLRDENNEHWQINVRSWYWQNDINDQDKLVLKTDSSDILETWQPLLVNRDLYLFYDTSTFQKVPFFRYVT